MKKQTENNSINLETLAGGAFTEKLNEALMQVAENIQNPNTDAVAKRGITVNIKFAPNKNRSIVNTSISVTTKLASTEAIDTQLIMGVNIKNGEIEIAEYDGQIRGQLKINEWEQPILEEPEQDESPVQPSGQPVDLRNRGKKKEVPLVAGQDFDPNTGEVYEADSNVVAFGAKAAQA